jgi:hypothetical protein
MLNEVQELRGWLQKKGEVGLIKGYKRRWFQQLEDKVFYFNKPEDKDPLGSIELGQFTVGKAVIGS